MRKSLMANKQIKEKRSGRNEMSGSGRFLYCFLPHKQLTQQFQSN